MLIYVPGHFRPWGRRVGSWRNRLRREGDGAGHRGNAQFTKCPLGSLMVLIYIWIFFPSFFFLPVFQNSIIGFQYFFSFLSYRYQTVHDLHLFFTAYHPLPPFIIIFTLLQIFFSSFTLISTLFFYLFLIFQVFRPAFFIIFNLS